MDEPIVHPRIMREHSQLSEDDVKHAWLNSFYEALRPDSPNFPEYVWIGLDATGREIEMVGTMTNRGFLIYHANTPVSKSIRDEVKRNERRR